MSEIALAAGRTASPFPPTRFANSNEAYGNPRVPGDLTRPRLPAVRYLANCYLSRGTTRDETECKTASRGYRSTGATALRIRSLARGILHARNRLLVRSRGYLVENSCALLVGADFGLFCVLKRGSLLPENLSEWSRVKKQCRSQGLC